MKTNQIYHSNPFELEKAVNRSIKELTVFAKWSTWDLSDLTNTDADLAALIEEGLPCVDVIPNPSDSLAKLYPVTNHIDRLDGKQAALIYLYFYPMSVKSSGGAEKTAEAVNTAIKESLLTSQHSDSYNQTVMRNSAMVSTMPNWFRPKFVVNANVDYFDLDETSGDYPSGTPSSIFKPEFGIGLNLPFEESSINKALRVYESVSEIDVYAQCYQPINVGGDWVFQQYPVFCEAKFIVVD